MSQHLVAAPRWSVRAGRNVAVGVSICAAALGVGLSSIGMLSAWDAAVRVGIVVVLAAAWVWANARLLRLVARTRPERMPVMQAVQGVLWMTFFLAAWVVMMAGTGSRAAGMFVGQMVLMMSVTCGMTLLGGGWGRRAGESLHCPKCEYEFGFWDVDEPPVRCPECGTAWLGQLKKGRRVRSGRMMAAGVVIAALGVAAMSPVFYIHRLAPHLPTPVLYAMVYVAPVGNDAAWKEMRSRPLDESWSRRLEQRVLGERADRSYTDGGGRWIESRMAAGSVDVATRERFFREGFAAELIGPESVRAGEEFTLTLRVRRAADAGSMNLVVMFEGYSVGMGPFVGRQEEAQWGHDLRPGVMSTHKDVFVQRVRAEGVRPGETLRVGVVYWVMYLSGYDRTAWQRDGTPTRPRKAVWFERVELEGEVRVE